MTLGDHSDEEETNAKNRDQGSSSSPNSSVNDNRCSELLRKGEANFVTTRAWDAIDLPIELQRSISMLNYRVPIGMIDSGICPRARTLCFYGLNINGESFIDIDKYDLSDGFGHGTMVASIIAGYTGDARFHHLKSGTARGGMLNPDLYIYKTDGSRLATQAAVFAASKENIAILNISMGIAREEGAGAFSDPISMGTFLAMQKGILPVAAVGNSGEEGDVHNFPSWICSVTGYNHKWKLVTTLTLLNNPLIVIKGHSRNFDDSPVCDLVLEEEALIERTWKITNANSEVSYEVEKSLKGKIVKGKIIVSKDTRHGEAAQRATKAGAEGIILIGRTDNPTAKCFASIPILCVSKKDGENVLAYMQEKKRENAPPRGKIWKTTEELDEKFPTLAELSSRRQDKLSGFMLTPDIGGIALDVFCAAMEGDINTQKADNLQSMTFASGTSMATAMVSSVAGYIKSKRQSWSPSAIKSAMMTSATRPKYFAKATDRLGAGCGIPNPVEALYVRAVYETTLEEHCAFIQSWDDCDPYLLNLSKTIHIASEAEKQIWNINYPSFMATIPDGVSTWSFKRRLKFLGEPSATFEPRTVPGSTNLTLVVDKPNLHYTKRGQELPYTLTVTVNGWNAEGILHGEITWVQTQGNMTHSTPICSPIVIVRGK